MPWSRLPTSDATGDGPEPAALRDLVDVVLAGLGAPTVDALVAVHESWATIVGEELVAHAHPISVEAGCLRIGVDSPAWASHLRWSEPEIVGRAERVLGPGVVVSVSTRVVRSGAPPRSS
jgi:hypothetical protein